MKLITDKPEEVYHVLYRALERLIINRINDGAFTDQEDVTSKGYFSTLEGLETVFIPFVNLPKNVFWDPLSLHYKELPEIISKDISFILSHNSKEDSPPKEQGTPYFEHGKGVRQTPYWTSECASFTLSALTNYLLLCEKVGLTGPPQDKIIKAINSNLKWVDLCKRDKGWSWTTDSSSHPWPTWSILDTFEEMLNCDLLADFHTSITSEIEPILNKIIESFKTNVVGSYASDWEEKVINSRPYDVEAALDLSRLILAISLHSNRKIVKPLAIKLYSWASETDFGNVNYNFHLQTKLDYISDSSLIPSVMRTLIVAAGVLKYKGIGDVDKNIGQNHKVVLNRVHLHLMKNQINHGKFKDLWGVDNEGLTYELYYTERTVEALTEFLIHYEPDFKSIPITQAPSQGEASTRPALDKAVSTATESTYDIAPAYLPILDDFARKVKRENGLDIFKDVIIIFVLHFLNDLLTLVEKFQDLGCMSEDMFFLVKTYDYPQKEEVKKYFESKGSKVVLPADSSEVTFFNTAKLILDQALKQSNSEGKKIMIVEDGGYFAPIFHSEEFIDKTQRCLGAVEQTTKGHRRDSTITDPQFPIISVATSKLKLFLEAQEVAETLQENIVSTLRKYTDKPLNKQKSLVLGFGTIGQKLCEALHNKGFSISIYDKDFSRRLQAEMENRYKVLENLDNLSEYNIIIGVSGETSLKDGKDFWNLPHNVILASGSSEKIEFDLETLSSISSKIVREEIFTKYILKKDDKIIRLMLDGEPINFALSGGIANSIIDPIYAEMFLAAVEVTKNSDLEKGLQELPQRIEEEVLRIFKSYHSS